MEFLRETQDLQEETAETARREEAPERSSVVTEDHNAVALTVEVVAAVAIAIAEVAVEAEETIGFPRIRTRPKRYWTSSSCNSKLRTEVTLKSSSMPSKKNSIIS